MKSNIVLIGFMGTGKTTNGRRLAKRLGKDFIDTDLFVESRKNMKIEAIFDQYGEEYFRKLERDIIDEIWQKKNKVISTGGGIVLNPKNIELLKRNGVIFLLESSVDTISNNLKNSYKKRPLLEKKNWKKEIVYLLNKRKDQYLKSADYIVKVEGKTHQQIVSEINHIYNKCK